MMPLTLIGPISRSDSNHSLKKSTALIVIILRLAANHSSPTPLNCLPMRSTSKIVEGVSLDGSGMGDSMIGFIIRPSSLIA